MTSTWQPIETAPKDGTWILVTIKGRNNATGGPFVPSTVKWGHCDVYNRTGWMDEDSQYGRAVFQEFFDPTHWMPLPEPPA